MRLYLVRHAEACEIGEPGIATDAARVLTDKGRKQAARAGQALLRLGEAAPQVWSSPLIRARQTAELLAAAWPSPPPVLEVAELGPRFAAARLLARLQRERLPAVLWVGHEPSLGLVLHQFLAGSGAPGLPLGKAGLAALDLEAPAWGQAELAYYLSRAAIRQLLAAR